MPDIQYYLGKSDGNTKINNSDDLALYLLDKAQVAVVGGDAFGAPNALGYHMPIPMNCLLRQ